MTFSLQHSYDSMNRTNVEMQCFFELSIREHLSNIHIKLLLPLMDKSMLSKCSDVLLVHFFEEVLRIPIIDAK